MLGFLCCIREFLISHFSFYFSVFLTASLRRFIRHCSRRIYLPHVSSSSSVPVQIVANLEEKRKKKPPWSGWRLLHVALRHPNDEAHFGNVSETKTKRKKYLWRDCEKMLTRKRKWLSLSFKQSSFFGARGNPFALWQVRSGWVFFDPRKTKR